MADDNTVNAVLHEENVSVCPDCGNENIDFLDDERVCTRCGLVIE